jgi:hypothetical protein
MTIDSKKTELDSLIAKIKQQQEVIEKQITISFIDIDLQLDYIRALYEHYIAIKQSVFVQEKTEEKSELSDCGTLPLFNNSQKIVTNYELQVIKNEKIEEDFEDELEKSKENFENLEEDFEDEEDLFEENEETDDDEIVEEEKTEEIFEEEDEIEEEEIIEDEETEEDFGYEKTDNEENIAKDEDFLTVFPEMEIEKNIRTAPDIDIDSLEFEEDEDEDTSNEEDHIKETPITHIGTSGQPRYWGDELDVEPPPARQASIGERYNSDKPSLNEIVSGFKPDDSIGMKLQHTSVSDLMKSIDMNMRFLFVKNLFKGNGSFFTEEINKINSIGKLQEAIKYLEEIKDKYNWDDKSEAYTELYKLILRKYAR